MGKQLFDKHGNIYLTILMCLIGINITFNYSTSNLGLHVKGMLVPFNQAVLIWGIMRTVIRSRIRHLEVNKSFIFLLILCTISIFRMLKGYMQYGAFALRDGSNFLDAIYLWCVSEELSTKRGSSFLKNIWKYLDIICVISLVYYIVMRIPFSANVMNEVSPIYHGMQSDIKVFSSLSDIMLWQSIFAVMHAGRLYEGNVKKSVQWWYHIQILLVIIIEFAEFNQSGGRSTLISLLVITVYLFFVGGIGIRKNFCNKVFRMCILGGILLCTGVLECISSSLSVDTIINVIKSIWGKGTNVSKAGGTSLRLQWWKEIFEEAFFNWKNLMFGKGFGMELTTHKTLGGVVVREPHNSFISVFARTGVMGLSIWAGTIGRIYYSSTKKYSKTRKTSALFIIALIVVMCIVALVEPIFENSYVTMPFYSLIAIMLCKCQHDEEKLI